MDKKKRDALIAAGWAVGDAGDLLGLTEEDRQIADLRAKISTAIRRLRTAKNWTQKQLAERTGSSQSRIAKLEACAGDVSLDLMFTSLFAIGGRLEDLVAAAAHGKPKIDPAKRRVDKSSSRKRHAVALP